MCVCMWHEKQLLHKVPKAIGDTVTQVIVHTIV